MPGPGSLLIMPQVAAAANASKKKDAGEPKIAKGATNFRLPSSDLLRMPLKSERIEEDELKELLFGDL